MFVQHKARFRQVQPVNIGAASQSNQHFVYPHVTTAGPQQHSLLCCSQLCRRSQVHLYFTTEGFQCITAYLRVSNTCNTRSHVGSNNLDAQACHRQSHLQTDGSEPQNTKTPGQGFLLKQLIGGQAVFGKRVEKGWYHRARTCSNHHRRCPDQLFAAFGGNPQQGGLNKFRPPVKQMFTSTLCRTFGTASGKAVSHTADPAPGTIRIYT